MSPRPTPGPDAPEVAPGGYEAAQEISRLIRARELGKAEAVAKELLAKYPNNPRVHGYTSRVHFRFGRFAECRESLKKAIEGDASWKDELRNKNALIEFLYGHDDKVKEILGTIESRDPGVTQLEELMAPKGLEVTRSKSGHYLVYTEPVLKARGGDKYAARALDLIYDAYARVFPFPRDEKVVYRCYILSKTYKYRSFLQSIGKSGEGSKGLFFPTERILVVDADAGAATTNSYGFTASSLRTVFHEAFHQFINLYVPDIPLWFNEGLADYFGNAEFVSKKKISLKNFPRYEPGIRTRYDYINEAVRAPKDAVILPLDLESFLRQTDTEFRADDDREYMNYCQGWSFVHFLLSSKKGTKILKTYFRLFREGSGREEAYQQTFGKVNLKKLEAAWRQHIRTM